MSGIIQVWILIMIGWLDEWVVLKVSAYYSISVLDWASLPLKWVLGIPWWATLRKLSPSPQNHKFGWFSSGAHSHISIFSGTRKEDSCDASLPSFSFAFQNIIRHAPLHLECPQGSSWGFLQSIKATNLLFQIERWGPGLAYAYNSNQSRSVRWQSVKTAKHSWERGGVWYGQVLDF